MEEIKKKLVDIFKLEERVLYDAAVKTPNEAIYEKYLLWSKLPTSIWKGFPLTI